MTDPIPPTGLEISQSPLKVQLKAQLRIWLAALCGALVTAAANRLHLPVLTTLWGLQGDQVVGILAGGITLGAISCWQWARDRIVNSRWWHLAIDPDVPDRLVRPAPSPTKGN